jgi:hypothetical protein
LSSETSTPSSCKRNILYDTSPTVIHVGIDHQCKLMKIERALRKHRTFGPSDSTIHDARGDSKICFHNIPQICFIWTQFHDEFTT